MVPITMATGVFTETWAKAFCRKFMETR